MLISSAMGQPIADRTTWPSPKKLRPGVPPSLAGFSFRALIDWIEIELTLQHPSQWHAVKRRAYRVWGNIFVESLEADESSTRFRLRVQDPSPPEEFLRQLQTLARAGELLTEDSVKITGVEIAIDAMHPSNDPEILAKAALHLMRHQASMPKGQPRITVPPYFDAPLLAARYAADMDANSIAIVDAIREGRMPPKRLAKKEGACPVVASNKEALLAFRHGLTVNQGRAPRLETDERGDSYRSRIYVKTNDTRDGIAYAPLPAKEHSARSERTWIDQDVPFSTIEAWRSFRFETLAKYFALVLPVVTDNPLVALLQKSSIQLGRRPDSYKIRSSDRRKRAAFTCRDSVTNDKIRQALRALTRSQCCQNSVKISRMNTDAPEGECGLDTESPKYINTNKDLNVVMTDQSPMTGCKPEILASSTPTAHSDLPPRAAISLNGDAENRQAAAQQGLVKTLLKRLKAAALDLVDQMDSAWHLTPN